ncbi:PTS system mannose/fructose/sorbose family transporter subunit IID [Enterococcus sp. AZ072]|uniref:PTS system mannose/fructose/sorbose family transporter subunit IID n=1 Tax=unclassified Enterococcus TaxID=2608891 RepID=UPI003D280137
MNNDISFKKKRTAMLRYWLTGGCGSFNYEKMQGLGYCYSMYPVLKEIYKDDQEGLKQSLLTHLQFFNTNAMFTPFIMGVNIAIEENEKEKSLPTVSSLKTSLMGPLAGLGDTLLLSTPSAIFGGIAASMAVQGNPAGVVLWLVVMIAIKSLIFPFFKTGYKTGLKMISTLEEKMQQVTASISTVGLMVVGSLIATVVSANVKVSYKSGDLMLHGQDILDSIMPNLIPALLVALVYWLLGRKNMTPVRVILIVIALAIGLSLIGLLG